MDDNTKLKTPSANEQNADLHLDDASLQRNAPDDDQELDEDDDDELGESKHYRVPRTGDRDIIFTGKLIGTGNHYAGYDGEYEARIFATEGGKFLATRRHTINHPLSITHLARVCESAETVAAFFHITPPTPAVKRGQRADPPVPYLCEDGKEAIEGAASFFDDFEVLYLEEVD